MVARGVAVVLGTLGPLLAGAADQPANMIVSFDKGPPAELFGLVYKLAFGLFVFALIVALFLEFLNPPDQGPQFVKVGVRAVAILVTLLLYPTLAGTVVKSLNGLATKVAPSQFALLEYFQRVALLEAKAIANPNGLTPSAKGAGGVKGGGAGGVQYGDQEKAGVAGAPPQPSAPCPSGSSYQVVAEGQGMAWKCVADYVAPNANSDNWMAVALRRTAMESALSIIFTFLGAVKYVVEQLGAVLTAVFYILGPLALVAGIPKKSGTAGNWFKHFVTYASWPVFTSLVMQLVIAVSVKTVSDDAGYADALLAALAVAMSFSSVPMLAGQIIGAAGSGFVSGAAGAAAGAGVAMNRQVEGMRDAGRQAAAASAGAAATGAAVAGALLANSGGAGGGGAPPGNRPGG